MHKFIGGVDSPGVLVAKKNLLTDSSAPDMCGGGTVFFVSACVTCDRVKDVCVYRSLGEGTGT